MITVERLRERLHYDLATGVFTWRPASGRRPAGGTIAGSLNKISGYWYINADNRFYLAHRLAWLYVHGVWPKNQIDHIDGNRANNCFANLRDVTHRVNLQNQRRAKQTNKTGFLGVNHHQKTFRANICLNGKTTHIGCFPTPELAHIAYVEAKRKYHEGCTL